MAVPFKLVCEERAKPNRYQAIAYRYLDLMFSKYGGAGIAWHQRKDGRGGIGGWQPSATHPGEWDIRIEAPNPSTPYNLMIFLHEIGHIDLLHHDRRSRTQRLQTSTQEYEAEMYALDALRREGIPMTKRMDDQGRWYVGSRLRQDARKGLPLLPAAVEYAGTYAPKNIRKAR